jgi:hypothetical protein
LLPTVEVTARGRHLYFRYPSVPVRNLAGKMAPGIDVRGDGGTCWRHRHPSGKRYCWSVDSTSTISEAPAWLIDLVAAPANGNSATASVEWRALVAGGVVKGQRDCTIAKLVGLLCLGTSTQSSPSNCCRRGTRSGARRPCRRRT